MNSSKLMYFFAKGDKGWSDIPQKEQEKILKSFLEPQNDIERSYYQYKCQQVFRSKRKRIIFDVFSFVAIPFLIVGLLIASVFKKKGGSRDALGSMAECKNVVPDSLKTEFKIDYDVWMNRFSLRPKDIFLLWKVIIKTPIAPYFVLKVTLKMAAYSEMIYQYQPKAIIVHDEYSFTSSVMTWYSNQFGVEHIDVMHGEKLYYINDTFFHYNRCYVWDEHYKTLLIKLRAESSQFIIEQPEALRINLSAPKDATKYAKYKYYLQKYDENELKSIIESLAFSKKENADVIYRPHPLSSDLALLKKYVPVSNIENPREVTLEQSLINTDVVIGYFSTVLFQAHLAGKKVCMDDVTFREGYSKLKEYDYIMTSFDDVMQLSGKQNK